MDDLVHDAKTPRVGRSPLRCPYCHEQVALRGSPWVACSGCLARHHADCWMGQGGCASCMGRRALLPATALNQTHGRLRGASPPPRRRSPLVIGALLVLAQLGITAASLYVLDQVADPDGEVASAAPTRETPTSPSQIAAVAEDDTRIERLREDLRLVRIELERRELQKENASMRGEIEQIRELILSDPLPTDGTEELRLQSLLAAECGSSETLRAELEQTRSELADSRAALAASRRELRETAQLLYTPQPTVWLTAGAPIQAKVLAVKQDVSPNLVLISAGVGEGVIPGLTLTIFRGKTFVAKVLVERVLADSAGCRVLFRAGDLRVHAGDSAVAQ